jgi:hypothetical protein
MNSDAVIRYIAQLYAGDYNWRRLFNMNPSLGDPDLIFTNNNRLVVGSLCVSSQPPFTSRHFAHVTCSTPLPRAPLFNSLSVHFTSTSVTCVAGTG